MDKELIAMLICPVSHSELTYDRDRQELKSSISGLAYPVRDGIPVMLENEARIMPTEEKLGKAASAP